MIRKLYDWVFALAKHKQANTALAGVSFAESSIFPIPPDVLLIPMVLANRHKWVFLAALCTIASVLGALLGYYIGFALYETIGKPIVAFYGKEDAYQDIKQWYDEWGGWGVIFAAITPFPYKILAIFSGVVQLNLVTFIIVSIVGRGFRFFLVSLLIYLFGEPIREFIEKRLGLMFTLGMILLIGGFAAVKFIF